MKLKTAIAFVGTIVILAAIGVVFWIFGISWVSASIVAGLSILLYILGAIGSSGTPGSFEEFCRGACIGLNASCNGFIGFIVCGLIIGNPVTIVFGSVCALITVFSVFGPISQSEFFQGIAGWLTWFLPMSWLIVGVGFLFFVLSILGAIFTAWQVNFLSIKGIKVDWKTGTLFVKGGWIANLNFRHTAFNMGNFSFVDKQSGDWHIEHEAGHTLNLTAFGSLFHLWGALDENVLMRGHKAFAELLAESNVPGTGISVIPMWK